MATIVIEVSEVKCERVDIGGFYKRMRIELPDGRSCWYRATLRGFDNIDEFEQAEEEVELEAAYQLYMNTKGETE